MAMLRLSDLAQSDLDLLAEQVRREQLRRRASSHSCQRCGGSFFARAGALYCSARCRVAAHRAVIPAELRELPAVRWEHQLKQGSWTKVPLRLDGRRASSTDPATWTDYATAKTSTVGEGVGLVLDGRGIGCIDLDDCVRGDGTIEPWAKSIIDAHDGTYIERSVSGSGVHIWGYLSEDPARNKIRDGRNIELYRTGRYIALGRPFPGTAMTLIDLDLDSLN